jgi:hypothetical protein
LCVGRRGCEGRVCKKLLKGFNEAFGGKRAPAEVGNTGRERLEELELYLRTRVRAEVERQFTQGAMLSPRVALGDTGGGQPPRNVSVGSWANPMKVPSVPGGLSLFERFVFWLDHNGGAPTRRWVQVFADSELELEFRNWYGRSHRWFYAVVGCVIALFTMSFYFLRDIPATQHRSTARNVGVLALRAWTAIPWAALVVGLARFPAYCLPRLDTLLSLAIVLSMLCSLMLEVADLWPGSSFPFIVVCLISVSPFRRFWSRAGSQMTLVIVYVICAFALLGWSVDAIITVSPVLLFLPQGWLTGLMFHRALRRHYILCHASPGTLEAGNPGTRSADIELSARKVGESDVTVEDPTETPTDDETRDQEGTEGEIEIEMKKYLRWLLFFRQGVVHDSLWRSEILFRRAVTERDRMLARATLLTFSLTSLVMLIAEIVVLVIEKQDISLTQVIIVRSFVAVLPLVVAAMFSEDTARGVIGKHLGFDFLVVISMFLSAASLVWLEAQITTDTSDITESSRFERGSPDPLPPSFLYQMMFVKQLFVIVAAFKTPMPMNMVSCVASIVLHGVLVAPGATVTIRFALLGFIGIAAGIAREREEKVSFLVHNGIVQRPSASFLPRIASSGEET